MISKDQSLSILFYLKVKKATKDGKIPIYVRLTIDGFRDEFSCGCKVFRDSWDTQHKRVLNIAPDHKRINKKLLKIEVDLLRHFDLIQAKLLPVPSNQQYNKRLKEIARLLNFKINLRTHKARFFMANVVTYDQGIELKTIGKILGQKSIKTTEIYVEPNQTIISENIALVQDKLFKKDGSFKKDKAQPVPLEQDLQSTSGEFYSSVPVVYSIKQA